MGNSNNSIPVFSVHMPVYNSEEFVRAAIESILNQSFVNFELLIVDDGSTDKTTDIISDYLSDGRLKFFKNEENKGIAFNRRFLLEHSIGEIIVIADSDDISHPKRLEFMDAAFKKQPDCVAVGSQISFHMENGQKICQVKNYPNFFTKCRENGRIQFSPASLGFQRTTALAVGSYDASFHNFSEDIDLLERILKRGKGYNIPYSLLKYRLRRKSAVTANYARQSKRSPLECLVFGTPAIDAIYNLRVAEFLYIGKNFSDARRFYMKCIGANCYTLKSLAKLILCVLKVKITAHEVTSEPDAHHPIHLI